MPLTLKPSIRPALASDGVFQTNANALLLDNTGNVPATLSDGGGTFIMKPGQTLMLGSQTDLNKLDWRIEVMFDPAGVVSPEQRLQIIEINNTIC